MVDKDDMVIRKKQTYKLVDLIIEAIQKYELPFTRGELIMACSMVIDIHGSMVLKCLSSSKNK